MTKKKSSQEQADQDEIALVAAEIQAMMGNAPTEKSEKAEETAQETTEVVDESATEDENESEAEGTEKEQTATESLGDEGEKDEKTEEGELAPIEERLKLFEPEADTDTVDVTPRGQLTKLQKELETLEEDIKNTRFPMELPQGGIFQKDGKPIYGLSQQEINDYLIELKDAGREYEAGQVQTVLFNAQQAAANWQNTVRQKQQKYVEKYTLSENLRNDTEYRELRKEVSEQLPELTDADFQAIASYIDTSFDHTELHTKEQKAKAATTAATKLGIFARLKAAAKPEEKTPSAPEARLASKKVKSKSSGSHTYTRSQVDNMKQEEFNKLPADVVDRLLRGEGIIED